MNYYSKAIKQNEVFDFFRGKGEYFDADLDREGSHNFSFTSYNVMGYGTENGESTLYQQLDKDLLKYINLPDFSLDDLKIIIGLIWVYFLFRKEDHTFKTDWIISSELIDKIHRKIVFFEEAHENSEDLNRMISSLSDRFDFHIFDK